MAKKVPRAQQLTAPSSSAESFTRSSPGPGKRCESSCWGGSSGRADALGAAMVLVFFTGTEPPRGGIPAGGACPQEGHTGHS